MINNIVSTSVFFGFLLLVSSPSAYGDNTRRALSSCTTNSDCPNTNKFACVDGQCICNDGYIAGVNGGNTICLDFDECAAGVDQCDDDFGYCVDWDPPVKYRCACLPGYTCANDLCTSCVIDTTHSCNINNGGCNGTSTCKAFPNNGTRCECGTGFIYDGSDCVSTGINSLGRGTEGSAPTSAPFASCATVNEPGSIKCPDASTHCEDVNGRPTCLCNTGYFSFQGFGGSCIDIDECSTVGLNNCTGGGRSVCTNLPASYRCQCSTGFTDFPASLIGTDCRTTAEIEAALAAGGEVCFVTGLNGISATQVAEGQAARTVFTEQLAAFFGLEPDQIVLSNITDTVTVPPEGFFNVRERNLQTFSEEQLYAAFSCEVCITVTEANVRVPTSSVSVSNTNTSLISADPGALNKAIELEIARVVEKFEDEFNTDGEGNSDAVDRYFTEIANGLDNAGVLFNREALEESYLQGISFIQNEMQPSDRSANEILEILVANGQNDSPLAQSLREADISVTPTVSPSQQGRLLALDENDEGDDFFGDFVSEVDTSSNNGMHLEAATTGQSDDEEGDSNKGGGDHPIISESRE